MVKKHIIFINVKWFHFVLFYRSISKTYRIFNKIFWVGAIGAQKQK